ncbi:MULTISPECIES: 1-deoxy-D-xylulose-5-phosphate reductoisomerase [Sphingomonas]|uniref:1-deoxy-D-xylulose 5-phosphate reductoisomerase n=1 Tax=Edaphosphingomonas fennica TaxID=114404 RepID=A0A2T4I738_9SPHN|nr:MULTISPECIES: 1-deoxy-D-xylulose-5-phosphate reductoisomerase [Sphingomonas]PTD26722.1 1-deoxy-D-xylulose-5-phosphate reductoisomerase [Sphingomonas fennica]
MAVMRTVSILGATGSVGTSTLDLIDRNRDAFEVVALTAHSDVKGLADAARRTRARFAAIGDAALGAALAEALAGTGIETGAGEGALIEAAARDADWTMAAIVGCAGLKPVMAALKRGATVALANKESLVSAGDLMTLAARTHGATLLPVDSEHNAIFQCLDRDRLDKVRRIILTASGGPFRTWSPAEMAGVTPERAVKHPNWSMGAKISIDSATMMNKGLELIEAHHLFPVGHERIDILVHPQSVIHSMVEYVDGSTLAQLGTPDMRTPIAHALAWPQRMAAPAERLDLARIGSLSFEAPDPVRFPALALARAAVEAGGARPAILNAANEQAVAAFLGRRIAFLDIAAIVAKVLDSYDPSSPTSLDEVFAIDAEARRLATAMMEEKAA